MASLMDGIWAMADAMSQKKDNNVSRSQASVTRVDNEGIVWVHIPGGTDETPVNGRSVADAKSGDTVLVEISGGRCSIVGNATSPAIGVRQVDETVGPVIEKVDDIYDTAAEANEVAGEANRIAQATNQHFWADGSGVHVAYATKEQFQQEPTGPNQLSNANGILLRDGETYLSAFTPDGVVIYDGQGNDDVNRSAEFGPNGISFYVKKEILGHDRSIEAMSLTASEEKYGIGTIADFGELQIETYEGAATGGVTGGSSTIGSAAGKIHIDGTDPNLISAYYSGNMTLAGAGPDRGVIDFVSTGNKLKGKLSLKAEAHDTIELVEDEEGYTDWQPVEPRDPFYPADAASNVRASCGVELDTQASYTGPNPYTLAYNSSNPKIRMWSSMFQLEGQTKSHNFKMDDVIDTLLGESTSVYKGDITSWAVDLSDVAYKSGWYWTIAKDGSYAGEQCEVGDLLFAISDRTNETGQVPPTTDFTILQTNLDVISAADIDEMMRY